MKTYRDLDAFKKRVARTTDWDDYFLLGGRMYQIYEYGSGHAFPNYVYFINKRTHDAIEVFYDLPTVDYKDGVRVEKGEYRLHSVDFIPNMPLWRPII